MPESENVKGIDREKAAARLGLADENGQLALSKQSLLTLSLIHI